MRLVRTMFLSVLVLALVPVSSALAQSCASNVKTATLVRGNPADITVYNVKNQQGVPVTTRVLKLATDIYQFNKGGTVSFGKNTYVLGANTIVTLGCYAESRNAPNNRAEMSLFKGSLTLSTNAKFPGEVLLDEGLITTNPGGPFHVVIKIKRTPATDAYNDMMMWAEGFSNQPAGISTLTSRPGIDVTPYVGKGVGNCRYSTTRAILNSHGATKLGQVHKGGDAGGHASFWQGSHKVA